MQAGIIPEFETRLAYIHVQAYYTMLHCSAIKKKEIHVHVEEGKEQNSLCTNMV